APAQALGADALGGQGWGHAHGHGGRGRPRDRHYRRRARDRAGPRLGPGTARPGGRRHAPVGRRERRRRRSAAARRVGGGGRAGRALAEAGGYRQVSWILRLGPRIFGLRTGKLCPSHDDANGANHAEFANVRESRALRFARRPPPAGAGPATGPAGRSAWRGCTAEVRRRCGGSVATKIAGADGAGCSRGAWTAPPPLAYRWLDRSKTMSTTRGGRAQPCHGSTAPSAAGRIPTEPGSARTAGPS